MEGRPTGRIPPAPVPLERTPPPLTLFRMMRRNLIETLTRAHYEDPTVTTRLFPRHCRRNEFARRRAPRDGQNAANHRRQFLAEPDTVGRPRFLPARRRRRSMAVAAQRRTLFSPRAGRFRGRHMIATSAGMVDERRRQPDGSRINLFDEISAAALVRMVSDALLPDGIGDAATAFPDAFTHYVEKAYRDRRG
ncbi:MAG: hypothetical protein M9905_17940 [Rhizobiaceae bacterium]|nr:hypothetical protein [Rhizobiaceae bacterium]